MVSFTIDGFHTLTPIIVLSDANAAIALYKKVFEAKETYRLNHANGKIIHACLQVGGSKLFLSDFACGSESESNNRLRFYIYVGDVDAVCNLALENGFEKIIMPPEDMFWGDRIGTLRDPFGVMWSIATHVREVSDEEMATGQQEILAQIAC